MADVRQRISLLGTAGMGSGAPRSERGAEHVSFKQGFVRTREKGISFAGDEQGGSAAGHEPMHGAHGVAGGSVSSRHERQDTAMCMWREWAEEALGQLCSEPRPVQLSTKTKRAKELERKCAALASQAQRRLAASACLRDGDTLVSGSVSLGDGSHARRPGSASHQPSSQQASWAARELRKSRTYDAVRDMGRAERAGSAGGLITAGAGGRAGSTGGGGQPSRSHAMLDALLVGGGAGARPQSPPALQRHLTRYNSSLACSRPARTARAPHADATAAPHSPARPRSAAPAPSPRPWSGGAPASATGGGGGGFRGDNDADGVLSTLQAESESLRVQRDEAHACVQSQSEVEAQLRDTIDLLRARLHGQSQRELENQRRLQQHSRLEPLFDRLAESFSFQTPEQVLDRLELLEDDRLGTFDQLLQTQDEVSALQAAVNAAGSRAELLRTQLTTEHLRNTARLNQTNEELRGELEAMRTLNARLQARQGQLVLMQSAVADLWGRCQDDPDFVAANATTAAARDDSGGGGGGRGGGADGLEDPLTVLSTCKEYLIARSAPMADRHYIDAQRVANRAWARHFAHVPEKRALRGRVVETFEQLSTLADMLAARVKTGSEQLKRSKASEKFLSAELERLQRQQRVMEGQLEERERLVRGMAGLPRKHRPSEVVMRTLDVVGPHALLSPAGLYDDTAASSQQRSGCRPHSASAGSPYHPHTARSPSTSGAAAAPCEPSRFGGPAAAPPAARPSSAPLRRTQSGAARASHAGAQGGTHTPPRSQPRLPEGGDRDDGSASAGATPRRPLSARPQQSGSSASAQQQQQQPRSVHVAIAPVGEHWSSYSKRTGSAPVAGALFGCPAAAVGVAAGHAGGEHIGSAAAAAMGEGEAHGNSTGSQRWVPPSKASLEASFLSRLTRAAQP
ncbi:hypothetical protein FOA52_006601 [Chlamydomonas sp. UWO 241]|nr:hypothetical protein FOA52_006601 [Chlamydomonas sp. UWO 241]